MRSLHFHAAAAHPGVARALAAQADATLRPFDTYLWQSIRTAQERQVRYALPWEPVAEELELRLRPLDTRLRLPQRPVMTVLVAWPAELQPDLDKPCFRLGLSETTNITDARSVARGLAIETADQLVDGEQIAWCGDTWTVCVDEPAEPPRDVRKAQGVPLTLREPAIDDGAGHWVVVIEGNHDDQQLLVDGELTAARSLPALQDLRYVRDRNERWFAVHQGALHTATRPAEGPVVGDNDVRFICKASHSGRGAETWVQILPPDEVDSDATIDPREAFFEGDVREVWTTTYRKQGTIHRVRRGDSDRYRLLLDPMPPAGTKLHLPAQLRNLKLQRRAIHQLRNGPLPHHQGLLRMCEDPRKVRWPEPHPANLSERAWRYLRDPSRDGTDTQRRFVCRALGTSDLAILEGPPGSGKTTAICELIHQLRARGLRVLLCASTHVAIDNVLERMLKGEDPPDAVRLGRLDRVDSAVQHVQLEARVQQLVETWKRDPELGLRGVSELTEMAERSIVNGADLTCATTLGVTNHPLLRDPHGGGPRWQQPIGKEPHWDVLIVDEASKTLIQEFLVPALLARRWIIVGDIHQLSPYTDRDHLLANLRELHDGNQRRIFPPSHQRACLLLFRLLRPAVRDSGARWLHVEPQEVLQHLQAELAARGPGHATFARVVRQVDPELTAVTQVTLEQLERGDVAALHLAAADHVLVERSLFKDARDLLPSNLALTRQLDPEIVDAFACRQPVGLAAAGALDRQWRAREVSGGRVRTHGEAQLAARRWLERHDLASELVWRITRQHDLRQGSDSKEHDRLDSAIERLLPATVDVSEPLAEIEDIGLPSILEVLQVGIGSERSSRPSALTEGLAASDGDVFEARFDSLGFQHRMHPDIAEFPRRCFYAGETLRDANTIAARDKELGWDFGPLPARRAWADVDGRESGGVNADEIATVRGALLDFIDWAEQRAAPDRTWQVACLTFYVKQHEAMTRILRKITGQQQSNSRFTAAGGRVELVAGTVDRFQGREADLVLLSMRNTRRVGFLDSPNRLNVALTRARHQLIVVGRCPNFAGCRVQELRRLAQGTPKVDPATVLRWRTPNR